MIQILTQLYRDATELELAMGPRLAGDDWDAVVLFILDLEPGDFIPFAQIVALDTPVFLADCYGILGYSAEESRNIELMEAGRGREYGGVGGDGGQGVVVVAFRGGVVATVATLPDAGTTAHMVVAAHGSNVGSLLAKQASSIYYGGVAKATFRYDPAKERSESIPSFLHQHPGGSRTGDRHYFFHRRCQRLGEDTAPAGADGQSDGSGSAVSLLHARQKRVWSQ